MNKDKRFDIRLSDNDRAMLRDLSLDMNRSQSDAMRLLIRDAHAKMLAEREEKKR